MGKWKWKRCYDLILTNFKTQYTAMKELHLFIETSNRTFLANQTPSIRNQWYLVIFGTTQDQHNIVQFRFPVAMTRSRTRSDKGGARQRLKAYARERDGHVQSTSALARLLLSLFSWGEMSPQLVQKIASAAFEDAQALVAGQSTLEDLEKIASIGSARRYPNKCYFDLLHALPFKVSIPMATSCKLTFKESLGDLTQHVLLPHKLFAALFHSCPSIWRKSIMPDVERQERFWQLNRDHPAFQDWEIRHIRGYNRLVIPLSMHGDGVPITGVGKSWCQQMTTFSWSSTLRSG